MLPTDDDTVEYGGDVGRKDTGGIYDPEYGDFVYGGLLGGGGGSDNPYRDPNGGAYGPDTCRQGYVWRDSFDGDTHCVTPAERDAAHAAQG